MPDFIDLLQWPAMLVTVAAAYLIGSTRKWKRNTGFWLFLTSNLLWIVWGFYASAYALVVLQFCLGAMNVRGLSKTQPTS